MTPVNNSFTGVIAYTSSSRTCQRVSSSKTLRAPLTLVLKEPIPNLVLNSSVDCQRFSVILTCVARFRVTDIILACAEPKQPNLARQRSAAAPMDC